PVPRLPRPSRENKWEGSDESRSSRFEARHNLTIGTYRAALGAADLLASLGHGDGAAGRTLSRSGCPATPVPTGVGTGGAAASSKSSGTVASAPLGALRNLRTRVSTSTTATLMQKAMKPGYALKCP